MEGTVSIRYLTTDYLKKITRGEHPKKVRVLQLEGKRNVFGDAEKLRQLENLRDYVNLEELYLAHNAIHRGILNELLRLTKLRILDLSYNGMEDECLTFGRSRPEQSLRLEYLEILRLSHNQLSSIPEWISNCSKLREFQMSFNCWNHLGEIDRLENLKLLQHIDLRGNSIDMHSGTREFLYVVYRSKFLRVLNGEDIVDSLRQSAQEVFFSKDLETLRQKISDLMRQRNDLYERVSNLEVSNGKLTRDYREMEELVGQLEGENSTLRAQMTSLQSLTERQAKQLMDYVTESVQINDISPSNDRLGVASVIRNDNLLDSHSKIDVLIAPHSNFLREHAELYQKYNILESEHALIIAKHEKYVLDEASFKDNLKQKIVSLFDGVKDYREIPILEMKDANHLELDDVLQLLKFAFIRCNESLQRELLLSSNEESLDVQRLKMQQERIARHSLDIERSHKDSETMFHRQLMALKDMIDIKDRVIHAMQSTRTILPSTISRPTAINLESFDIASIQLKEIDDILTACLGKSRRAASLSIVDAFKLYLQLLRKKIRSSSIRTSCNLCNSHDRPFKQVISPVNHCTERDLSSLSTMAEFGTSLWTSTPPSRS